MLSTRLEELLQVQASVARMWSEVELMQEKKAAPSAPTAPAQAIL